MRAPHSLRGNNAPFGGITDGDRPALEAYIIALLDRRVEGIHVDMDDLARR